MRHARLAGRARVRGPKFKVFETSSPELRIAPVALGVPVARLRALVDFFSILLEDATAMPCCTVIRCAS